MPTLKENIQSNKGKILYYFGLFLVSTMRNYLTAVKDIIPQGAWWTDPTLDMVGLALFVLPLLAQYIFGKDADLDRVKKERKDQGLAIAEKDAVIEGLRITNKMQGQLLIESGALPLIYTYDGEYMSVKAEGKAEEKVDTAAPVDTEEESIEPID